MTMLRFKDHTTDISSTFLTRFDTAFGTISETVGMSDDRFTATIRTGKEIVTKMDGRTEDVF